MRRPGCFGKDRQSNRPSNAMWRLIFEAEWQAHELELSQSLAAEFGAAEPEGSETEK